MVRFLSVPVGFVHLDRLADDLRRRFSYPRLRDGRQGGGKECRCRTGHAPLVSRRLSRPNRGQYFILTFQGSTFWSVERRRVVI